MKIPFVMLTHLIMMVYTLNVQSDDCLHPEEIKVCMNIRTIFLASANLYDVTFEESLRNVKDVYTQADVMRDILRRCEISHD